MTCCDRRFQRSSGDSNCRFLQFTWQLLHLATVPQLDRLSRHTQQCGSCRQAYQRTQQVQTMGWGSAVGLLALGVVTEGAVQWACVLGFVLAAGIVGLAAKLKTHFEQTRSRS